MSGDSKVMAWRLTQARKAKGLKVDQIADYLIDCRMAKKRPTASKPRQLWIGWVRRWFHYGLETIPDEFQEDFELLCALLETHQVLVDPQDANPHFPRIRRAASR
jgi:hypothetical protein